MIISKRIKIPKRKVGGSSHLLDYIQEYLNSKINGDVLRFAIVGLSGQDLLVDVSVRITTEKAKKGRRKDG